MNENSSENGNSNNTEIEEVQALDENETDIEIIKAHAKAVEDRNKQLFARTKKAEGFELKDGKWTKKPGAKPEEKKSEATITKNTSELSQTDLIFIAKADIHQDDIPELIEYAKFKGISLVEASNDSIMKGILAGKAETRKIADGTNTGGGKRGNAKLTDEALLENARNGKFPESDEDMRRLTILHRAKK